MKKDKKRRLLIILLIIFLLICIFVVAILFDKNGEDDTYVLPDFVYEGIEYNKKDNIDLIFFAGLDTFDRYVKEPYRNEYAADSIIVFVLDNKAKTITPIHINSEMMCKFDLLGVGGRIVDSTYGEAYLAHTYGNGELDSLVNVKNTISDILTGISFEYYFSSSMNAVPIVNDALNYIDVYVEEDFSNVDPSLKQNEVNTLKGDQSLTFIRSKISIDDETNISRMNRQEIYFNALFKKAKKLSENDDDIIADTINSINKYLVSNVDIYTLIDLTNTFIEYDLKDSVLIKGDVQEKEDGTIIYVPNEKDIVKICIEYFYDEIQ